MRPPLATAPRLNNLTALLQQGQCLFESEQDVGWDQRRFAAPAHQQFSMLPDGGPALQANWSHPTLKKAMALIASGDETHWPVK